MKLSCPQCGAVVDAAMGTEGDPPTDGDRSICLYCGTINIFHTTVYGLSLRVSTLEELDESLADPRVAKLIHGLKLMREQGLLEYFHSKGQPE